MKLQKLDIYNFGSYKELHIDFSDLNLCLINGPTGSGKSTILDAPTWCLFGITAKDGKVDDVRSWTNQDEPTVVSLTFFTDAGIFKITRTRGSPGENDLFIETPTTTKIRGKDLKATQQQINDILGFTSDEYLSAAYFHEFSQVGRFFTLKPKEQKEVFEQIVDLTFPSVLNDKLSIYKKEIKDDLLKLVKELDRLMGAEEQLKTIFNSLVHSSTFWEVDQENLVKYLKKRSDTFKEDNELKYKEIKEKHLVWETELNDEIATVEQMIEIAKVNINTCRVCGSKTEKNSLTRENHILGLHTRLNQLTLLDNPYSTLLLALSSDENTYADRVIEETNKKNPFVEELSKTKISLENQSDLVKRSEERVALHQSKLHNLDYLTDLVVELRGRLIKNNLKHVESSINTYMSKYFDSEFRVNFDIAAMDSLDVKIYKNNYECSYKQLSKGQRCLLKLTFSVSLMTLASNKIGQHFHNLFFDEALDGLDTELKLKAYHLFEELSTRHSSIFVVDHNDDLKNLFFNKISVKMIADRSEIVYEC